MEGFELIEDEIVEDCPHQNTIVDPDETTPHARLCTDCDARLLLTREQAEALALRDDGAYWVTSLDGQTRFAGPFLNQGDADVAAETIEASTPGTVTDIAYLRD